MLHANIYTVVYTGEPPAKRQRTDQSDVVVVASSCAAASDPFEPSPYAAPPNRSLPCQLFRSATNELRRIMKHNTFTFDSSVHRHMTTWAFDAIKALRGAKQTPDTWITAAEAVEAMIAPAGLTGPDWDGEMTANNASLRTLEPHQVLTELLACVHRAARQKKNPWNEFFLGAYIKYFLDLKLEPHQIVEAMRLCHKKAETVCKNMESHTISAFVFAATKQRIESDLCVQVFDAVRQYPILICISKNLRRYFKVMICVVLDRCPDQCIKWTAIEQQDALLVRSAFGLFN